MKNKPLLRDTEPDAALTTSLFAWCENILQTRLVVRGERSHDHNESCVWELQSDAGGTTYYVKSHRRPHKWEQEAAFYEDFLPLAPPDLQTQTPRLLAAHQGEAEGIPRALLLSALPGVPLESMAARTVLSPDAEREAWECAGRYLAHFHTLPLPATGDPWFGAIQRNGKSRPADPPTSPVGLIVQDLQNALAPLPDGSPLTENEKSLGREGLEMASAAFDNEPPVLCQRDFSPRNWLVHAQTSQWVGVIDFEHTRRDVRIADIAKWWDGPFLTRPDWEAAFWTGYGPWPDTPTRFDNQLRLARIVQSLGQIKWARAHDDAGFETRGHEAAARLLHG